MNALMEMMLDAETVRAARKISAVLKPSRRWRRMESGGRNGDGAELWSNELYTATCRRHEQGWPFGGGPWAQIGIYCEDGEARHDWRDFQRIKNDLVGALWEAIELYPSEARIMDPSNYYMLWAAPAIAIGKYEGRVLMGPRSCIAPQRGWSGDAPPEVLQKETKETKTATTNNRKDSDAL